jgi:hypothetical protein
LFAAAGDEVIRALKRAGFHVCEQTATYAVLEHGYRRLTVRRGEPLDPDELLAVLRGSAVSYTELVELLDAPRYESSVRRRTLANETGTIEKRKTTK